MPRRVLDSLYAGSGSRHRATTEPGRAATGKAGPALPCRAGSRRRARSFGRGIVAGPGYRIFTQHHLQARDVLGAEHSLLDPPRQPPMDFAGKKLGRRVPAAEFLELVEVAVLELAKNGLEQIESTADVADDPVGVERITTQLGLDDISCTVRPLRRTKHLAGQAVGGHEMMTDGDAVHGYPYRRVWQRIPADDAASCGINAGNAVNSVSPENRTSNTGSRSSERARVRRRRSGQRRRRAAGTVPTCEERKVRRRE